MTVLDEQVNASVKPGWVVAACEVCELPQPFRSREERDGWARAHAEGTGHTVARWAATDRTDATAQLPEHHPIAAFGVRDRCSCGGVWPCRDGAVEALLEYGELLASAVLDAEANFDETVRAGDDHRTVDMARGWAMGLRTAAGLYGLIEGIDPDTRARIPRAYRRFPEGTSVRAERWMRNGDHPHDGVGERAVDPLSGDPYVRVEGAAVRFFRHPDVPEDSVCPAEGCGRPMLDHGWIDWGVGGQTVHPGDWVSVPGVARVPVDQSTWPAHLRDDAPSQQCSGCLRFTWATSEFGQVCGMPQPDGLVCGRFGPVDGGGPLLGSVGGRQ